jgi:Cu/Ag efflux protein CusF
MRIVALCAKNVCEPAHTTFFYEALMNRESLKGEVATVDEASGKIGIKLAGTVGSGDTTAPISFKVQDGLVFNAVKPGDKVSIVVERNGDEMTIKKLTKE